MKTPKIVCLCGSTRFSKTFREANLRETLAGNIVLTVGCDTKSDTDLFGGKSPEEQAATKANLDQLHLRKVAMADEVLILNVGGYIGESTRRELNHALDLNKWVRYWMNENPEWTEERQIKVPSGIDLITAERARQVEKEGYTPEHDDQHDGGELSEAAAVYLEAASIMVRGATGAEIQEAFDEGGPYAEADWPWVDDEGDYEGLKIDADEVHNLAKAGALIAAEIDRLQRLRVSPSRVPRSRARRAI